MLDEIRDQSCEIEFLKAVMKNMLKDGELQKIRLRAQYDDEDKSWQIPPFFLKNKEINLPKIKNAKALVEEELDKRDMEFGEDVSQRNSYYPPNDGAMRGSRYQVISQEGDRANGGMPIGKP